ncbi:hypothetical protein GQ600_16782 [Phytophthora cactorum]|nr:hypothetical protein GQ600_16782 [Phytophthora cactorum]
MHTWIHPVQCVLSLTTLFSYRRQTTLP